MLSSCLRRVIAIGCLVLMFGESVQKFRTEAVKFDGFESPFRAFDPSDFGVLKDLYYAANGPHWDYPNISNINSTIAPIFARVPWNFTDPDANPCIEGWSGIQCAVPTGHNPYFVSHLYMENFNMSGQLPASLGNFAAIEGISMLGNSLSGTIPAELGNLTTLRILFLDDNDLTGILPDALGYLSSLVFFGCSGNSMTGSIPTSLGQLTRLLHLDIHKNMFSHSIPSSLGNLAQLELLYLLDNEFTGTLPDELSGLKNLRGLYLSNNFFSGTLPDSLHGLSKLQYLVLHHNFFNGVIPVSYSSMSSLGSLALNNNNLEGNIPASFSNLSSLYSIALNDNYLQGTIPSSLSSLKLLLVLHLQSNHLQDFIPTSLSNLSSLQILQLQNNYFEGSMQGVIDAANQPNLNSVLVSNNLLTGPVPDNLPDFPFLHSYAAATNCLQGTLPAALCQAGSLYSLIIDGLGSARGCNRKLLPGVSNAYQVGNIGMKGLPACLLQLPNLTTLHLSGNGLTGPLPTNFKLGANLVELALSHNRLTGTIPLNIQLRRWYQLDLSYNMLSGTLNSDFASENVQSGKYPNDTHQVITDFNTSMLNKILGDVESDLVVRSSPLLYLENNRLSGRIPGYVHQVHDVSILGSNSFQCNFWRTNLPQNDSGLNNYQCGSSSFNNYMYVWVILTGSVVLVVLTVHHCQYKLPSMRSNLCTRWMPAAAVTTAFPPHVNKVFRVYAFLCQLAVVAVGFMVLVLLPCYVCFSVYYGTMTHQYAWVASAAYISGTVPFGVEFSLLTVLLVMVISAFAYQEIFVRVTEQNGKLCNVEKTNEYLTTSNSIDNGTHHTQLSKAKLAAIYSIFLTMNLTVVLGVNITFVLIAIYRSNRELVVAQVLLSMFKISWNSVCARWIIYYTARVITRTSDNAAAQHVDFVSLQLFVALFNNIVIPCLVVMVVSPSCFYNLFHAAPSVGSTVLIYNCYAIDPLGKCKLSVPALYETSYDPPFSYSYQCSSSLITYYAPAYVSLALMSTFITPGMQYTLTMLHRKAVPQSCWSSAVGYFLPHIFKVHVLHDQAFVQKLFRRALFDPNRLFIQMVTYIGVLLTFGAVFPPLAVTLVVAMVTVCVLAKTSLSIFLQNCSNRNLSLLVQHVNTECKDVASSAVLYNALWMLVSMSCTFYTIFLFDTLGDAVGWDDAYWLFIVIPLLPLVLFALHYTVCKLLPPLNLTRVPPPPDGMKCDSEVEMSHQDHNKSEQDQRNIISPLH